MDPPAIAACLPGCQSFEPLGDDHYKVVLTAGIAAISGTFEGRVTMADKRPGESYRLLIEGRGRPGFVLGESTITLTPDGDNTVVHVAGTAQIGGLVAQVGQRLVGATARMMMDRFFACLQQKLVVG
jgi:carbon monoxide dehydrogenase subunit G